MKVVMRPVMKIIMLTPLILLPYLSLAQEPFSTPDPTTHIQVESDVPEFSVHDYLKNPILAYQARDKLEEKLEPFNYSDGMPVVKSIDVHTVNSGRLAIVVTVNKEGVTKDFEKALPDTFEGWPVVLTYPSKGKPD